MWCVPLLAWLVAAHAQTWYGLTPGSSPLTLSLVELSDLAVLGRTVATANVGAGEVAVTDAMRCLAGFCAFMTRAALPGAAASYAYRVNTTTGALLARTPLPGLCLHMHVDYSSGNLYTLCQGSGASKVYEVAGAAPVLVVDISAQLGGGARLVQPGETTHCSAFKSMYIGVARGGANMDAILTVNLAARTTTTVTLQSPLWRTLWARCDGSNEIGGVAWTPGAGPGANGTAAFGTLDTTSGAFQPWASVGVPSELEPSGLLTETETEQAIAAFYPRRVNASAAAGFLWAVDPFSKAGDDFVSPISFNVRPGRARCGRSAHTAAARLTLTSPPLNSPPPLARSSLRRPLIATPRASEQISH